MLLSAWKVTLPRWLKLGDPESRTGFLPRLVQSGCFGKFVIITRFFLPRRQKSAEPQTCITCFLFLFLRFPGRSQAPRLPHCLALVVVRNRCSNVDCSMSMASYLSADNSSQAEASGVRAGRNSLELLQQTKEAKRKYTANKRRRR